MSPLYCFFFAFARESEIGRAGTRTAMDERHDRRRSSPDLRPFLARHRSPHLRPLPAHRLPSRAAPLPSCLGARTSSSPPRRLAAFAPETRAAPLPSHLGARTWAPPPVGSSPSLPSSPASISPRCLHVVSAPVGSGVRWFQQTKSPDPAIQITGCSKK